MPGNLKFEDVVKSVQAEAERLSSDGVDKIIALGHAGITMDKRVALIPQVDVVIGGHTNTFLYTGQAFRSRVTYNTSKPTTFVSWSFH